MENIEFNQKIICSILLWIFNIQSHANEQNE